jgi:hypothetical protein
MNIQLKMKIVHQEEEDKKNGELDSIRIMELNKNQI